jgi:hypothetical protein
MMGYGYDPFLSERSLKPPVFHTSTFVFRSAQDGKEFFELAYGLRQKRPNEEPGLIYSRINNPDLEMLEDRLAIWDQAEASLVFAPGMAAISTTLWAYARPGTVIIHSGPVYGGTDFLLKKILPEAASQRVTRLGGVLARRRPPTASPSSRRMHEPTSSNGVTWGGRPESTTRIDPSGLDNALRSRLLKALVIPEIAEETVLSSPATTIDPCKSRSAATVLTS